MSRTATLRESIASPFRILALLMGLLLANPVQAQEPISLDVGLEDETGLFFAAVSNDGHDFIWVGGLAVQALDAKGRMLSWGWTPLEDVLWPGETRFVYIRPQNPCNPDDVAVFDGIVIDPFGAILATDTYNNDIGIRGITYDRDNRVLRLTFKNTTQSDIAVRRIVVTWYRGREEPWSREYDGPNVPAGGEVPWSGRDPGGKAVGDSKVIKAYDPEGNLVGKGSHTIR